MNNVNNWIIPAIGGLASLIGIVAFFFPNLGGHLIGIITRLLPGPNYNWDEILKRSGRAKDRVWILQTWLPHLKAELPYWHDALKHQKMDFRVLLSSTELIAFRLRCRKSGTRSDLQSNIAHLSDLSYEFNKNKSSEEKPILEVRFYSSLPFGPIYIIDDDIYWGLYLADEDSMKGPVYHYPVNSKLGKKILRSYEAMWHAANPESGNLKLTSHKNYLNRTHGANEEAEIDQMIGVTASQLRQSSYDDAQKLARNKGFLAIIRHGDTDLNVAKIISGDLNIGINAEGRIKAKKMTSMISAERWDHIYSSPLRRCTETLIEGRANKNYHVEIELMDQLKERDMGDVEGFSKSTYSKSLPQYNGVDLLTSFHTYAINGEAYCDVFWRVYPLLKDIVMRVKQGERILVCSHEGPIRMMQLMLDSALTTDEAAKKHIDCGEIYYYLPIE